jgi:hypothetical protein
MEQNIEKKRQFAGKTEFVLDYSTPKKLDQSKNERHFYQRMLRAYLKGKTVFEFGFTYDSMGRRRGIQHEVLVRYV